MEKDKYTRKISELDENDKPREKALNFGVEYLTNAELIAIILGSGLKGMSVLDLSQEILKGNDNKLSKVARMSIYELCTKFKGVGPAKAISLLSAIELGSRCIHSFASETEDPVIKCSRDIYNIMRQKLERKNHEEFWIIYLNQALRVQSTECISQGGMASTVVDIRLILKKALDKLSSSIILIHNHPSGNLKPSVQDDNLTKKVKEGAKLLDINLIDHVIISSQGYYSYSDEARL